MFFRKKIKKQFTISIPDPCNEDWNKMQVVDSCHRNCAACDRVLTDFAQMNDDELVLFFAQSQGKICGRFRKDQLNRAITPLPEKTTKATWWKAAALLPLTLFSKNSNAQQLYPDSAKTEQVPFMVQTDTVPPPNVVVSPFAQPIHWDSITPYPWGFGEPYHLVGVPMVQYDYRFNWGNLFCVTTLVAVFEPPKTESALGLIAAGPKRPVAVEQKEHGSGAAKNFGAAIAPHPTNG